MRTMGEIIVKTTFTFRTRKKSLVKNQDSIFSKNFLENEFLKDVKMYQKKTS